MSQDGILTDPVHALADMLAETEPIIIKRLHWVYKQIGPDVTRALLIATNVIEQNGGLFIRSGTRRKTKGGVFFELTRRYFINIKQRKNARSLISKKKRRKRPMRGFAPAGPNKVRFRKKGQPMKPIDAVAFHEAIRIAFTIFPEAARLLKVGGNQTDKVLILHFAFPDVATSAYADLIQELMNATHWRVHIYPRPNQKSLMDVAQEYIAVALHGTPSVRPQDKTVTVRCTDEPPNLDMVRVKFADETGWQLTIKIIK